jgi:nucleotide-binding universal stress UspA family protein
VVTTRILLAIDDSVFSCAATDAVVAHIRPEDTLVHVMHVLELDRLVPPPIDFARGNEYGPDVAAHVKSGRAAAEALITAAEERLRAVGFSTAGVIREGDPRSAILDYAAEWNSDWIVMGSHGRQGLDRFFMGSVSETVARHAHCSVQIARLQHP